MRRRGGGGGRGGVAGIPHYWIVDITEPVSLIACRGYRSAAAVTGTFTTDVPFPVKIDLNALLD
ncbi:hypothetical protein [Amycolatopsis kentuckyensis]|uniref:hypothetical protein n=1 Tax=Amycolatopsis kentuckyensis TaxID=218823 RepID=UPI0035633C8F